MRPATGLHKTTGYQATVDAFKIMALPKGTALFYWVHKKMKMLLYSRFVFYFLFLGDALLYSISSRFGIWVFPIGLLSSAIALLAFVFLYKKKGEVFFAVSAIFVFMLLGVISAVHSPNYDWSWLLNYHWYFAAFSLGVIFVVAQKASQAEHGKDFWFVFLPFCVVMFFIYLSGRNSFDEDFNYLRVSGGFFAVALLFYVYVTVFFRLLVYVVGVLLLYMIGSRSWFYLWLFIPALVVLLERGVNIRSLMGLLVVLLVGGGVLAGMVSMNYGGVIDSRIARLVLSTEADTSLAGRLYLFDMGLSQIKENYFLGYYNGFYDYSDGGGYIHNALSFWHQYGFFSFMVLILLVLRYFYSFWARERDTLSVFCYSFFGVVLIQMVLSLSYVNYYIFFSLGTLAALKKYRLKVEASGRPCSLS